MSGSSGSLGGLSISSAVEAGIAELRLDGELDLASAPELERRLAELERQRPDRLIVDLTALSFLDSTGLRVLLQAEARASERGSELVLRPGEASVQRIFDVTGALEVLNFEPSPEGSSRSGGPAAPEGPANT
jgi:anti-sigma B factor antagonist